MKQVRIADSQSSRDVPVQRIRLMEEYRVEISPMREFGIYVLSLTIAAQNSITRLIQTEKMSESLKRERNSEFLC